MMSAENCVDLEWSNSLGEIQPQIRLCPFLVNKHVIHRLKKTNKQN